MYVDMGRCGPVRVVITILPCAVCAACIRENIEFQEKRGNAQCPTCRVQCDARDLISNLVLRGVVEKYHALVQWVRDSADEKQHEILSQDVVHVEEDRKSRRRNPPRSSSARVMQKNDQTMQHAIDLVDGEDTDDSNDIFVPSQEERQPSRVQSETRGKSSFVQCPICNEHVFNLVLNTHIDSCLAQGPGKAPNAGNRPSASAWKPLQVPPKLMANLTSEKTVRNSLRKYGIPAEGRKSDLLDRYNRFRMEVTIANDRQEHTTYEKIAWRVSKKEKRKAAASLLRMDLHPQQPSQKNRPVNDTAHHGIDAYSHPREVQTQGHSYQELIRVTKLRDAVRKKMREKQQEADDALLYCDDESDSVW